MSTTTWIALAGVTFAALVLSITENWPWRYVVTPVIRTLTAQRKIRRCFHHDIATGVSYVRRGVNLDYRKTFDCRMCGKLWII